MDVSGSALAKAVLERYGIVAEPGEQFGVTDRAALRCCFAVPEDIAVKSFAQIAQFARRTGPPGVVRDLPLAAY